MKINLKTIADCSNAVKKLAAVDLGSPQENYRFMSVVRAVQDESKKFIDLQRNIVEKYRDQSKANELVIPFESIDAFNQEMLDAGEIEIAIDWDCVDCRIDMLTGFTAGEMQSLDGLFINIKGE